MSYCEKFARVCPLSACLPHISRTLAMVRGVMLSQNKHKGMFIVFIWETPESAQTEIEQETTAVRYINEGRTTNKTV